MTNDTYNEDWIKSLRWDGPASVSGLLRTFAGSERATGQSAVRIIKHLMSLPSWKAAPNGLKKETEAWLADQHAKGTGARAISKLMDRKEGDW